MESKLNVLTELKVIYDTDNDLSLNSAEKYKSQDLDIKDLNILLKPLCKKNDAKFKLSYHIPHLCNKSIVPHNDLLEGVIINYSK